MEDNINNKDTDTTSHDTLNETTPIQNVDTLNTMDNSQERENTKEQEERQHLVDMYNFYKSTKEERTVKTVVNKKSVALFTTFMCVCVVVFISCIVLSINEPNLAEAEDTIGSSDNTTLEDSTNYDFSKNDGIVINQYNPPERSDSTYMNEDGTYTVAGVAKYSGSSVLAIYVSKDGVTLNGMGSGIVFSDQGYILTNAHVVQDANYIVGITQDGTQLSLSFVGMDTDLDVAVLQSSDTNIEVATMGNSDDVILGEQVVAIGNPAGLTGTVTSGIVSSLDRNNISSVDSDVNYIQTDTALSPGSSGGALFNMYGQVIGITTLKISEDDTYESLGFAIRINDALECAERLIQNRFKIGIEFNFKNNEIEVSKINQNCSIANTELKVGDVITQINGIDVYDYSSVMGALEGSQPGDTVTAKLERRSQDGLKSEVYIQFQLMPY